MRTASLTLKLIQFNILEVNLIRFILLLLVMICFTTPTLAGWQIKSNSAGAYQAILAIDLIGTRVPSTAILIVDFDTRLGCRAGIGTAIVKGSSFGTMKKRGKAKTHQMMLNIDGRSWYGYPLITIYSNGVEAMIPANNDLLGALKNSTSVRSKISPSTPGVEFNSANAGPTIEGAESRCKAR